ncbi:MAG: NAD-dependent protein deacylase [candidate division Zixibacteria bacterium]|nr:NAD-dependent protein deacylase [candidate division Zixibacteria bacterium]
MVSQQLKDHIKKARRVAVLTGAGVSAESGVPTFRGEHGLWKKFRPEELANFDAFMRNPELVWEWYQYRRSLIYDIEPNPGHFALAKMENAFDEFSLITQNIDGLHQKAGSQRVIELHGNIRRNKCATCGEFHEDEIPITQKKVIKCHCGGLIRPDVVWFGEMLPVDAIRNAFEWAESCDIFFSVGTSAIVHPAAQLPITAKQAGIYVVEVNPDKTPITAYVDEHLQGPSGEILPEIIKFLE